jgi:hypothetical protein
MSYLNLNEMAIDVDDIDKSGRGGATTGTRRWH